MLPLPRGPRSAWPIFLIFLRLGLSAFGGPVAHLGYFHEEFVKRRQWLSEHDYADLVALCQFLPGPASSQVGMGIGMTMAGYRGAFAAWLGFTAPSAVALILFAVGITTGGASLPISVLGGLKIAAVAVVAHAVLNMGRSHAPAGWRMTIMLVTAGGALLWPSSLTQVILIAISAIMGRFLFYGDAPPTGSIAVHASGHRSLIWLLAFVALLVGLPFAVAATQSIVLAQIDAFYRAGSLVFGGGHVVLPLLQAEVVTPGWVSEDIFLAGYGAAQAVPGPLFTFASFLGAAMDSATHGWLGGLIATIAIFLPSFLLLAGVLPYWDTLRQHDGVRAMLTGVNASVVGLLLAALYQPVWTSAIHSPADFWLGLIAFAALTAGRQPAWLIVAACAILRPLLTAL